jgi:hypothetical protein
LKAISFNSLFVLIVLVFSLLFVFLRGVFFSNIPVPRAEQVRMSSEYVPDSKGQKSIEDDRLSISIPPQKEFLPDIDSSFVITFLFKQSVPPSFNRRQKLITHYESDKPPYAGWAIAFRRFHSSYRFEFYLQDKTGSGGWFSFDVIDLKNDAWYALTFIVKPDEFISGYSVLLNDTYEPVSSLKKLGGFPLAGLRENFGTNFFETALQSNLQITSGTPKIGPFKGRVEGLNIFQLPVLLQEKQFRKDVLKGSYSIAKKYPEACVITLLSEKQGAKCMFSHP